MNVEVDLRTRLPLKMIGAIGSTYSARKEGIDKGTKLRVNYIYNKMWPVITWDILVWKIHVYSAKCLISEFYTGLRKDPESIAFSALVCTFYLPLATPTWPVHHQCSSPVWPSFIQWVALVLLTSPMATALLCSLFLVDRSSRVFRFTQYTSRHRWREALNYTLSAYLCGPFMPQCCLRLYMGCTPIFSAN